jgi:hypothetical protein
VRSTLLIGLFVALTVAGIGSEPSFGTPSEMVGERAVLDTLACLDTLHVTDSVRMMLTMSVSAQDPARKIPRGFEDLLVAKVRAYLTDKPSYRLRMLSGWAPCDTIAHKCAAAVPTIEANAYATARANGELSRISVVDFGLPSALADSLHSALGQLSTEKAWTFSSAGDSIPLFIRVGAAQNPDTVPASRHLFLATVPRYDLAYTEPAWPNKAKAPRYPSSAERAQVGDSIAVEFTILADGTVAPQSVDVRSGHYVEFLRSVFDRMATSRYEPARVGSCAVASRSRQVFLFKIP